MNSDIKKLYIRLLRPQQYKGQKYIDISSIEQDTLNRMFMLRTMDESSMQLSFNFVANREAYEDEEMIYRFIVRHNTNG
jgi:hypothetical protein